MTINKLKASFVTIGFAEKEKDKKWEDSYNLHLLKWLNENWIKLDNTREIRLFKNNNTDIERDYVIIAKKKDIVDEKFIRQDNFTDLA